MRKIKNAELGRKSVDEFKSSGKIPLVIILDNVRSLHNIGSVFRTADAFLVEAIYLCGITAQPPHREIEKTALGATDSVAWKYMASAAAAVNELKSNGYFTIAVEQAEGSIPLEHFRMEEEKKYALVFGHEINGVGEDVMETVDAAIEIPQSGTKHSLNISVCAGVVLWEFSRQMRKLPGHLSTQ
ncbi:MAG: RNA methyltransferase [Bacteroidetes bacterium]|nr:RNA methyltransferase [Bacteroidota bacterium]